MDRFWEMLQDPLGSTFPILSKDHKNHLGTKACPLTNTLQTSKVVFMWLWSCFGQHAVGTNRFLRTAARENLHESLEFDSVMLQFHFGAGPMSTPAAK